MIFRILRIDLPGFLKIYRHESFKTTLRRLYIHENPGEEKWRLAANVTSGIKRHLKRMSRACGLPVEQARYPFGHDAYEAFCLLAATPADIAADAYTGQRSVTFHHK